MRRRLFLTLLVPLALAACETPTLQLGTDGKPLGRVNRIDPADAGAIQYRVLDSVNRLRQIGKVGPLQLNAQLTAAAATHARDIAAQNRPWHFGSDGSSPLDRARRAGYGALVRGENISETYENEVETLAAWMAQTDTRAVIMDPAARDLGIAWFQEPNGKIWWTLLTGG